MPNFLIRLGDDGGRARYPTYSNLVEATDVNHAAYQLAQLIVHYHDMEQPEWLDVDGTTIPYDENKRYRPLLLQHLKHVAENSDEGAGRYDNTINICEVKQWVDVAHTALVVVITPRLASQKPLDIVTLGSAAYSYDTVNLHGAIATALTQHKADKEYLYDLEYTESLYPLVAECFTLSQVIDTANVGMVSKKDRTVRRGLNDYRGKFALNIEVLMRAYWHHDPYIAMPFSLVLGKPIAAGHILREELP